jgi:putative two-component system response regulator
MLDRDPKQRPALPVTVVNALTRFAAPAAPVWEMFDPESSPAPAMAQPAQPSDTDVSLDTTWKVLIVHDDPVMRRVMWEALEPLGCLVGEASRGEKALALVRNEPCDLLLIRLNLPDMPGYDICQQLRERPPRPHIKVIFVTNSAENDVVDALARGADDCVSDPPDLRRLAAKVQYLLRLKDAQDRTDVLARNLSMANRQLADSLDARAGDVRQAHDALLFAMAKMAEQREGETAGHSRRLQRYCRVLGEELLRDSLWATILNVQFLEQVERCVPLHDIGKIGLPDALLTKPGPLDPSERALMETHTLIGASMLDALAREYGGSLGFLTSATVIVRYHHERYDGSGYPDGLSGDAIPPAGRLCALPDVYDALRRKRYHKPAMSHEDASRYIMERSEGHFDPGVLEAFSRCHEKFKKIYQQIAD